VLFKKSAAKRDETARRKEENASVEATKTPSSEPRPSLKQTYSREFLRKVLLHQVK